MNKTITDATYYDGEWKQGLLHVTDGLFSAECGVDTWSAKDYLILPGLINAHLHLGETIFRGEAPLSSLENYLEYTDQQSKQLPPNSHDIISRLTILESLRAGTTTFTAARGWGPAQEIGVRAMIGYPFMNSDKLNEYYDIDSCARLLGSKTEYPTGTIQLRTDLWIHSLARIDEKTLEQIAALFHETGACLAIHVAETENQVNETKKIFGCREVELLVEYGLLGKRTNVVHGLHLTDGELDELAATQTNVTRCLSSNLSLYSAAPPLKPLLERGINVSLGTDGLATGDSASLLKEASIAQQLYGLSFREMLSLVTVNPARTLHIPAGKIGLEYYADATILSKKTGRPTHVLVDGNFLMFDGQIVGAKHIENEFEELRGALYD